jgi:ATP-binding cassette subfamily F protein 3
MELEEGLEVHHKELVEVSNSGDSMRLMEISKLVSSEENQVEELFEAFEIAQIELDEINEGYDTKIEELS